MQAQNNENVAKYNLTPAWNALCSCVKSLVYYYFIRGQRLWSGEGAGENREKKLKGPSQRGENFKYPSPWKENENNKNLDSEQSTDCQLHNVFVPKNLILLVQPKMN